MQKIRIWDLPTRLFHWAFAVTVGGALFTQAIGGTAMVWHFRLGYAALALALFRVLWGIVGPRYARFASFLKPPSAILAYVQGRSPSHTVGHNPLGGLSVLAMLLVILLQAGSGLFSNDDIASEGPLAHLIDKDLSDRLSWFHVKVTGQLIYGLIGLHLLAIVYHRVFKKKDLLTPMVTGDQSAHGGSALPAHDGASVRTLAVLVMGACAAGVYGLVHW
jgi:cytochrome b